MVSRKNIVCCYLPPNSSPDKKKQKINQDADDEELERHIRKYEKVLAVEIILLYLQIYNFKKNRQV